MTTEVRILVADDEDQWRQILTRILKGFGCTVDTAGNYTDTRELLDKNVYALIVSDNGMPLGGESRPHRTCGLQLLAHAKAHGPNKKTPFVLHTADDDKEVVKMTELLGGIFCLKEGDEDIGDLLKKMLPKA